MFSVHTCFYFQIAVSGPGFRSYLLFGYFSLSRLGGTVFFSNFVAFKLPVTLRIFPTEGLTLLVGPWYFFSGLFFPCGLALFFPQSLF